MIALLLTVKKYYEEAKKRTQQIQLFKTYYYFHRFVTNSVDPNKTEHTEKKADPK